MKEGTSLRLNYLGRYCGFMFIIILLVVIWVLSIIRSPQIFQSEGILSLQQNVDAFSLVIPLSDDFVNALDSNFYIQLRIKEYPYQEYGFVLSNFEATVIKNARKKEIRLNGINGVVTTSKNKKIRLANLMKIDVVIINNDITLLKKIANKLTF